MGHRIQISAVAVCLVLFGLSSPGYALAQDIQIILQSAKYRQYYEDYVDRTSREDAYGLRAYLKSALEDAILDAMSQVNPIPIEADIRYFTEKLQQNMTARFCPPSSRGANERQSDIVESIVTAADEMDLEFRNSAHGRIAAILSNILKSSPPEEICKADDFLQLH
jgi:hypothetical protein